MKWSLYNLKYNLHLYQVHVIVSTFLINYTDWPVEKKFVGYHIIRMILISPSYEGGGKHSTYSSDMNYCK